MQFLVEERDVLGFGSEAIGTDAGQGFHLRPPYPCHYFMHGAGRYGLQCLANLDQLAADRRGADLPRRSRSGTAAAVLCVPSPSWRPHDPIIRIGRTTFSPRVGN